MPRLRVGSAKTRTLSPEPELDEDKDSDSPIVLPPSPPVAPRSNVSSLSSPSVALRDIDGITAVPEDLFFDLLEAAESARRCGQHREVVVSRRSLDARGKPKTCLALSSLADKRLSSVMVQLSRKTL